MSKCSHCGEEGHNVRTCPLGDVPSGPWLKNRSDRQHTKIVIEEDDFGGTYETEVPCDCQYFGPGERHHDFDGM